jgi:D-beta-D-heptose 7-phosphate kinase/D-beta-D-heptose 1-phosphate adenosyltransferase
VDRISPEAPIPVFVPSYKEERHGMAGNVFNNLESLGCEVNYLFGETSTKTRLIDIRSKQQIVRIDDDVTSDPIQFETAIPSFYDAVVISDYNKGTISYELIEEVIAKVICPVFIDTKKTDLKRLNGAYIKINQLEASRISSLPETKWLITTMGDQGAVWNGHEFTAKSVEVADVCGAGDTFLSALAYQYLNTSDMAMAIEFAIKASAVTVQHLGNYAPTLAEIK